MEKAKNNNRNYFPSIAVIRTSELNKENKYVFWQTTVFIGVQTIRALKNKGIVSDVFDVWFDENLIHIEPNGTEYGLLNGNRLTLSRIYVKKYKIRDGKYKMTMNDDGSIDIDLTERITRNAEKR